MRRLRSGEAIAGIAGILLFALTFFDWFGTRTVYETNLLPAVSSLGPSQFNAWQALDLVPVFLMVTTATSSIAASLRFSDGSRRVLVGVDALVAILGLASVALITVQIIDPPVFAHFAGARFEGVARYPAYLALLAAAVVALGGLLALREAEAPFFGRSPDPALT
jgi:hypothetical protein